MSALWKKGLKDTKQNKKKEEKGTKVII